MSPRVGAVAAQTSRRAPSGIQDPTAGSTDAPAVAAAPRSRGAAPTGRFARAPSLLTALRLPQSRSAMRRVTPDEEDLAARGRDHVHVAAPGAAEVADHGGIHRGRSASSSRGSRRCCFVAASVGVLAGRVGDRHARVDLGDDLGGSWRSPKARSPRRTCRTRWRCCAYHAVESRARLSDRPGSSASHAEVRRLGLDLLVGEPRRHRAERRDAGARRRARVGRLWSSAWPSSAWACVSKIALANDARAFAKFAVEKAEGRCASTNWIWASWMVRVSDHPTAARLFQVVFAADARHPGRRRLPLGVHVRLRLEVALPRTTLVDRVQLVAELRGAERGPRHLDRVGGQREARSDRDRGGHENEREHLGHPTMLPSTSARAATRARGREAAR